MGRDCPQLVPTQFQKQIIAFFFFLLLRDHHFNTLYNNMIITSCAILCIYGIQFVPRNWIVKNELILSSLEWINKAIKIGEGEESQNWPEEEVNGAINHRLKDINSTYRERFWNFNCENAITTEILQNKLIGKTLGGGSTRSPTPTYRCR